MTQPPKAPAVQPRIGPDPEGRGLLEIIEVLENTLAGYDPVRDGLLTESARLEAAERLHRLQGRVAALQIGHLHQLETDQVCWNHHGISTTTWLTGLNLTPRQAGQLLKQGDDLAHFPAIARAAGDGRASIAQAIAVTKTLSDLPTDLTSEQTVAAEQMALGWCADHTSTELALLSQTLLETIAPETADALEEQRLARQEQRAQRERHLTFTPDGHGTTKISGSLPTLQARLVETVLGAYAAAAQRKGIDQLDPFLAMSSRPQRLADALVTVCERIEHCSDAPTHGGDRPRLVITIAHDRLLAWAEPTGGREVGSAHRLTPGQLRQIACDADILPVVLGGDSQILDVGTTRRLVTPPIRIALTLRDRGCAFPRCDKLPVDCEAHHLLPWQRGGPTRLSNLVLLCKHHHATVEPDPDHCRQRWEVELHPTTGTPQVRPPAHIDPNRTPRQHARYRIRQ